MLDRRRLLAAFAVVVVAPATAAEIADPQAFVESLYGRLGRPGARQEFWQTQKGRAGVFSKALIALWKKAEDSVEAGDVGPLDFDVFRNAQDPRPGKPSFSTSDADADKAHVRVTLPLAEGKGATADDVLVFSLIKENGGWRIDNLFGSAGGDPWNLRELLQQP
jgi:hypothetical protein